MNRVTADDLRRAAYDASDLGHTFEAYWLRQAAATLDDLDKDIAVYEHDLHVLEQQLWLEREERGERP